jgi:Zn-dependent protease
MTPHFHVAGFPVRVHPLFFLTALATGWAFISEPARLAVWMAVVFVSVLLHEVGHALAFRRYGCPASISLHGMGGTTEGEDAERLTHRQSAWVSFAGPGAGFLLGGLIWALARFTPLGQQGGLAGQAVTQLLWANIGWGLFNLLPLQPLDGGHLLASAVRARKGYRYERALHGIGIATALALLGLAIWWKQPWVGLLALMFGWMNFEELRRTPREYRFQRAAAPPRRVSASRAPDAEGAVSVERLLGEFRSGSRAPAPTRVPEERRASAPVLTPDEDLPEGPHDSAMVGLLLLDSGMAAQAVRPLQSAFAEAPSPRTGHALVRALLETGRFKELEALLAQPRAAHLAADTLGLIAERAGAAGRDTLAAHARELRQGRES